MSTLPNNITRIVEAADAAGTKGEILSNASGRFSAPVRVEKEVFNGKTLSLVETAFVVWAKGNTKEQAEKSRKMTVSLLEKGVIDVYRMRSTTPFYEGQQIATKGADGESLGYYINDFSGTPEEALQFNNTFVVEEEEDLEFQDVSAPNTAGMPTA